MAFLFIMISLAQTFAFDWQGHRGARGLYPENTLGGMKEALKYPVTTLELDVVISKDEEVVLSHEPWMSPEICLSPDGKELNKKINLYELTYSEIIKFDCGSKPHPRFPKQKKIKEFKPLLKIVIEEVNKIRPVNFNVEIKSTPDQEKREQQPPYEEFTDKVIQVLASQLPHERFIVQSFDWRVLKYIHKKYPEVVLSALKEGSYGTQEVLKDLGFLPQIFSPNFKHLKQSDVSFFQRQKVKVIPWTVNEMSDLKEIKSWGVDGIITDYPNLTL